MSENKSSSTPIIIAIVAVIGIAAAYFVGKSSGDEQQAPNQPDQAAKPKPEPNQPTPKKPAEPPKPKILIPEGLVAYYPFNGNAKDESGNGNDGEVKGASLAPDRHGNADQAYNFDGSNDMIDVKDHESLRPSHLTISAWVYAKTTGTIVGKSNFSSAGVEQYNLIIFGPEDNNEMGFNFKRNSGGKPGKGWQTCNIDSAEIKGRWAMVTATWDGKSAKIFVDGKLKHETLNAPPGGIDDNKGGNLRFGMWWKGGTRPFNGTIDDARIYNRALSAEEITTLYEKEKPTDSSSSSGTNLTNGLVAYYPFNGNAKDETGNGHDGLVKGATLANDRHGNAKAAYQFDGINDLIEISDADSLDLGNEESREWTMSLWLNMNGKGGHLISKCYNGPGLGSRATDYGVLVESKGLTWGTGSSLGLGGKNRWYLLSKTPSIGEWQQIVVTYRSTGKATGIKTGWLDGKLIGETESQGKNVANNAPLHIGAEDRRGYWKGSIDDIRIYNRALSSEEITALYEQEKPKAN